MKKGFLAALLFLLLNPLTAGASPEYSVSLPREYFTSGLRYAVVYVLPQRANEKDDSGLAECCARAMERGEGLPMIIVRPELEAGDAARQLERIVKEIDDEYRTIPDPAHRAAAGTGAGGSLAYMLALDDGSAFGAAVSIRGDFAGSDNPWVAPGSVMERMRALHASDRDALSHLYTYMDAPVDDDWTDMPGSTADLGALLIGYGTESRCHEFTLRAGSFDADFMAESAARSLRGLSLYMLGGAVTGKMTLQENILSPGDAFVTAGYSVTLGEALTAWAQDDLPIDVFMDLDGESVSEAFSAKPGGTLQGTLRMPNTLTDNGEIRLRAGVMGFSVDLDRESLLVKKEAKGVIDLSGDWRFRYTGVQAGFDAAALTGDDIAEWDTVQPGLSSWTKGFGNISDANVRSPYGPDYFDVFIIGNGYYARTFTVPEDFDDPRPEMSIGCVDDRCEVFLNGVRIGATGMDDRGHSTGETSWAVYSHFTIDPALLRRGGDNLIVVRAFNDLPYGAGGWYAGPIGLYTHEAFLRETAGDDGRFYEETFPSAFAASAQKMKEPVENAYLIYLPPDYAESDRRYPTVYMLHQFNSDHTSYRTDGINELLDEGILSGLYDPVIVVIPNSAEESWWRGDWEKMVTQELIPHIDSHYRTIPDARFRMTAGCSMGGQGAFGIALRNPDKFTGALSFFGAFSYGAQANPVVIAEVESAEYLRHFDLYFSCGNQDSYGFGVPAIRLHSHLREKNVPHRFYIENGGHDNAFYLPRFQDAFSYMRANMYHTAPWAENAMSGGLTLSDEGDLLHITVSGERSLEACLMHIPASTYTPDSEPPLIIPVALSILQRGEEAYEEAFLFSFSPETRTFEASMDLSAIAVSAPDAQAVLKAYLFDRTITLAVLDLPAR